MHTKNSPFSSNIFQTIWKKHFISTKSIKTFKFIDGVKFYKGRFSFNVNIGKNLTKGNTYKLKNYEDYKNNTFIIYDVLPDLYGEQNNLQKNIGVLKSKQYPGYLINLDQFKNFDDYLLNHFSKRTRRKMMKSNNRMNDCFDISTKIFFGNIDNTEYNQVFENFMFLLQKRYSQKQISYNNMHPIEWNFYKEVAYPLILERKASLFVYYDKETPIAITYNYHTDDSLIVAITVYDIDYAKFNIGHVNHLNLIKWCFNNNLKVLDFSKGYFNYKKTMSTLEYDFEYHLIYDKKSISSKILAHTYYNFLEFKKYLRNKRIDVVFHKLTYLLKNKKQSPTYKKIEIDKLSELPDLTDLMKINTKKDLTYSFLTKYVNDFQYLVVKPYYEIEVFKVNNKEATYILASDSLIQQIKFKN